jgi:hypothetical protein
MASSGTIKSSVYRNHLWLTFNWTQSSQSITNNATIINWNLKLHWDARINFSASKSYSVTVNGTKYSGNYTSGASGSSGSVIIRSGATKMVHASDGTKAFNVNALLNIAVTYSGSYLSSMSLSGKQTLNTIPRASTISLSSPQVIINGTDGITVKINRKSTAFTHRVVFKLGQYSQTLTSISTSKFFQFPISWLNALTSTSLTGTCTVTTYNGTTQIGSSTSVTFKALRPSASTIALVNSTIECDGIQSLEAHISPIHSDFLHTVTFSLGDYSQTIEQVETKTKFVPPIEWLNAIPNATTGTGKMTVTTYYENIELGNYSIPFHLNVPINLVPSIDHISDAIINPIEINDWNIYVKTISHCQLEVEASGILGSTITKIYIDHTACENPYVDSQLNIAGQKSYSIYVEDSRGRKSDTQIKTIQVVDYEVPTLKINCIHRCLVNKELDDEGTYILINVSYTIASCEGKNQATTLIQCKESTENYYSSKGTFENNQDVLLELFEMNKAYDVIISVTDSLGKTASYVGEGIIPTSKAIIDILKGGHGIAFGKMASEENLLDSEWGIKAPYFIDDLGHHILLENILFFADDD